MPKSKSNTGKPNFLEGEFNLPKLEEKILAFWDEHKVFEKSLEQKEKEYVFYEGPPTANGRPGVHHILSRAFKDIIPRFKTMQGYRVPRKAGWDTHGLPVEIEVEKQLGLKSKKEIEAYGIKQFNEKCRESVWKYKDEWDRLTKRMGFWLDLKNPYITYQPEYMETLWWIIAQVAKKDLLYKGHRVVPWCSRCGTALSSHELAQGYKETTDNSVYLKFKLKPGQQFGKYATKDSAYILSWTTTPWTLPGNVALAVGTNIVYTALRIAGIPELYILASDLVKSVFGNQEIEIIHNDIQGKDLVGLEYEPLFEVEKLKTPAAYKIYPADFVTTTDGTGVVHTAVMYGEDDYELGKQAGLPQHHTVDEEGKFTKDVPALMGEYAKSKETEEHIFEHLRQRNNLLRVEPYTHEYPYCWRCGTPILYYARSSWFVAMSKLREGLLQRNETVHWVPEHVKEGRFGEWLKDVKDWNFSRERYWGTPLPIWECGACGRHECIGSLDELSERAGGSKNRYWIMRHGEAESNIFNIIDSGQRKYLHLTPRGQEEVLKSITHFKHQLDKKGEKIDLIISSDVTRTKETEQIDYAELGKPKVIFDQRIEEIHLGPTLTGLPDKKYAEFYPTYESRFEKRPEGGESVRDLRKRVWEFLQDCESRYEGKNILIITHEYPTWMFFHVAEGWSEKRAIEEKRELPGDFINFAEIRELLLKKVPRNDTGEVDLHRPFVDGIKVPCPQCKAEMKRVKEVADVWYDSGSMPFAQDHWPFGGEEKRKKKKEKREGPPEAFPADYISEAVDQTRGWFYTLLAVATLLGFEAPYRNVICLGHINDKHGQKMSKSKGNTIDPWMIMDKYGIDAVRWYLYTVNPPGEPKNFDEMEMVKSFRAMHMIVYNSFVFWKTYAEPITDSRYPISPNILDQWILARLDEAIADTTGHLDAYQIREAALDISSFVDDLSRWYIRRSRKRLQRPENQEDFETASATLHFILLSVVKLLAPFTPFFAEGLYAALGGPEESVHLDRWPEEQKKGEGKKQKELLEQMKLVRNLAALGLAARADASIKVRQPLSEFTAKNTELEGKEEFLAILRDEINVKKISFDKNLAVDSKLNIDITPELREEGLLREIARMVQELRQKAGFEPKDKIALYFELPAKVRAAVEKSEHSLKSDVGAGLIEYKRTDKFDAEAEMKLEDNPLWIGIRKV